jgi:RHS repeat-associated protein
MTTAAICVAREVSWSPSIYRGEQYDSDLGLYYLRARYYNPATGRFLGRDPLNGKITIPATLHKYLYVGGDPVNWIDPSGRDMVGYAINLKRAVGAVPILNAISCGVNIGISLSGGSLMVAAGENPLLFGANTAATVYGCLTISWAPTGAAAVLNKTAGVLACAAGIAQAVVDEQKVLNEEMKGEQDPDDVTSFDMDLAGGVFGCAVTLIGWLF